MDGLDVLLGVGPERSVKRLLRGLLRDAELAADGGERDVPKAQRDALLFALDGEHFGVGAAFIAPAAVLLRGHFFN